MNVKTKVATVLTLTLLAFTRVNAQTSYSVTDLGTLGGQTSAAAGMAGQQGHNAAGMIVGTSTASDNTAHAFLYSNGQMRDLNELCDLSTSDFNILTTASSIDDAGQIIGTGITASGQTHAFLLKPTPVDGGNWSYSCCQWIWKQGSTDSSTNNSGGSPDSGWWWESNCHCYNWHGPPGKHPPCPSNPPHCWYWPLPCSTDMGCSPYPPAPKPKVTPTPSSTPTPYKPALCWCCVKGNVSHIADVLCQAKGGQCYVSQEEANKNCTIYNKLPKCWCCHNGVVSEIPRLECTVSGGQCYASEAEANSKCVGTGYCCINNIISTIDSKDVCLSKGGTFSPTYKQALENCGPTCWCCINLFEGGSDIIQTTRTQCIQEGHNCYETLALAQTECPGEPVFNPDAVYCCSGNGTNIKGPVGLNECRDAGGVGFPTFNEALDHCHPGDPFLQQTDSYKTTIPQDSRFPIPPGVHPPPVHHGTPNPDLANITPPPNPHNSPAPKPTKRSTPVPQVTPFIRRIPIHDVPRKPIPTPAPSVRGSSTPRIDLRRARKHFTRPTPTPPIVR